MKWLLLASLFISASSFAQVGGSMASPNLGAEGVTMHSAVRNVSTVIASEMFQTHFQKIQEKEQIKCKELRVTNFIFSNGYYHFNCADNDLRPVSLRIHLVQRNGGVAFKSYKIKD